MRIAFRRLLTIAALLCGAWLLGALSACHTVEGAGEDVAALGDGVSNLADQARPYGKSED